MMKIRKQIEKAITLTGSQQKLAEKVGCSQQFISLLAREAVKVSAEMALALDKATDGKVSKHKLRPDIFGKIAKEAAE